MRLRNYWHPDYWGVGAARFRQVAHIDLAIDVAAKQRILDPRKLVYTESFSVLSSEYRDG